MLFGFKEKRRIKKHVIKCAEKVNRNIYNDDLWKARFILNIKDIKFFRYEDRSGYTANIFIELKDKQTLKIVEDCVWYSYNFLSSKFFELMNKFIIEDINVWKENPKRETSVDYRD